MLLVLVEGQTEEKFVNTHLRPILQGHGFIKVDARIMGLRHERNNRGGIVKWTKLRKNLQQHLQQSPKKTWLVTTMFDYYGLDGKGYPNWEESKKLPSISEKEKLISQGMHDWILQELGERVARKFFPYVMMYEFEGLLFSEVDRLAEVIGSQQIKDLQSIRNNFQSPEHINNNKSTAPSKRLLRITGNAYKKVLHGNRVIEKTTVPKIREECEIFNNWIQRLIEA